MVARNCHKSVYHAIELNDLEPIFIQPEITKEGISKAISKEEVRKKIEEEPEIKLLIITSPTYEGMVSDIKEIVEIAHSHEIPVLVDEAHGAHLPFMQDLKRYEAVRNKADIVIQSLHKTLPALTQCAILHIQGNFVKESEIRRQLAIFQTSSPSYVLMASIEECISLLEEKKEILFQTYEKNLEKFYQKVRNLKHLKFLNNQLSKEEIQDYGKIVILTQKTNLKGKDLMKILRDQYHIELEMASIDYAIAMTSICDKEESFERLAKALQEIDQVCIGKAQEKRTLFLGRTIPTRKMSIRKALQEGKNELIDFEKAKGKVLGEYVWIYPPGIPLMIPGEMITQEEINLLKQLKDSKIEVRTDKNQFPKLCVKN